MQDKIIILKNTKKGIVKDTIMSIQDTLRLDLKQEFLIPDNATIKTITDPPSGIEFVGLLVARVESRHSNKERWIYTIKW